MNRKEFLYITIGIFLTIIAWVIADIYYVGTKEKIKDKIEFFETENYKINKNILEIIKNKKD